jgi:hypothetical protein
VLLRGRTRLVVRTALIHRERFAQRILRIRRERLAQKTHPVWRKNLPIDRIIRTKGLLHPIVTRIVPTRATDPTLHFRAAS